MLWDGLGRALQVTSGLLLGEAMAGWPSTNVEGADMLETILEEYPKQLELKDGFKVIVRPLQSSDEEAFHEFFLAVPEQERMFIKHRVTEPEVIRGWCRDLDLGRNLPLLVEGEGRILADATLHQQLGGWKRHIGRVSVLVHPAYRGRGLARALVEEAMNVAKRIGLEKLEAEFIAEQERAIKMFGLLGFTELMRLDDYVRDMQALTHDYVLMGVGLETDEEYAGMG
jgi:GNAT superfamily N-acetyltransferase